MTDSGKLPVKTTPVSRKGVGGAPKGSGSKYTAAIADEIIERMASHGHTLVGITRNHADGTPREPGSFPSYAAIYHWADPDDGAYRPEFALRFARAKLDQQRFWMEEVVEIANTPEPGFEEIVEHSAKNGTTIRRARRDMLQHRTLKIDARLKAAERLDPARWAMRLQQAPPAPPPDQSDEGAQRIIVEGGLPDEEPYTPPDEPPQEPQPDE